MSSLTFNTTLSKFYSSYLQASYFYLQDNRTKSTPEEKTEDTKTIEKNPLKERVLTYYRNEILVTPLSSIAYIYIEHSITYVVDLNGKRSVANENLETLFSLLDSKSFFKVNRQIILSISAIKKIIKMGKGQLKVDVSPSFEDSIFVGKNKSVAFKEWLNG